MTPEDFWNQTDSRKDQKFYVAFCLLESALGDYAVARDLHCHNKLNWASTAYYYSLVHALRLLHFIVRGDFPTGHSDLATIYKNGLLHNKKRWLSQFTQNLGTSIQIAQIDLKREDLTGYFDGGGRVSSTLDNKFQKFGEILDKARECRNDSNYEGLIIAHEFAHPLVTDDFNKLATVLLKICEDTLPEVVLLFKKFIDMHPRKDCWYSYLNWKANAEGLYYLEKSLRFRLIGESSVWQLNNSPQKFEPVFDTENSEAIVSDILDWLSPLKKGDTDNNQAKEVQDNIKVDIFDNKKSLMQKFRQQIHDLETLLRENSK